MALVELQISVSKLLSQHRSEMVPEGFDKAAEIGPVDFIGKFWIINMSAIFVTVKLGARRRCLSNVWNRLRFAFCLGCG